MNMTKSAKVDAGKWYSLQDIVTKKLFAFCPPSFWSVRNVVALDRRNANILQAIITGTGRATKYRFKGENINNFISLVDAGKVKLG